jgi:Kef-type K+ transport system membrane component KefB
MSYGSFALIAAIALAAPLLRALVPALGVPPIVLELLAGILVGPHLLDLVSLNQPVEVFATVGLALLLFVAGMEVDLERLRGRALRLSLAGFAISLALGFAVGAVGQAAGLDESPLLVAIIVIATSLSVIIVPLKDAGEADTDFGQLVIAASSVAEFGALVLLALFFSGSEGGWETEVLHLGALAVLALVGGFAVLRGQGRRPRLLGEALDRMEGTTAQVRVRADFALVAGAIWLAAELGLEAILVAFTVGVLRGMALGEEGGRATTRLEAAAFGIFIPFFFVTSGVQLDLAALFSSVETALRIPLFLLVLLLVRAVPALLYRRELGGRATLAAGLLQATSLTFIVVASHVGQRLDLLDPATAAAFVGAGLLSVMVFPGAALSLLGRGRPPARSEAAPA